MKEIWKDVVGYEGYYQISSFGNVRSVDRYINSSYNSTIFRKGAVMKQQQSKKGYMTVHLSKNGISKRLPVHRLVAKAFIPNPDDLPQVNHKDTDKTNNKVLNLEWITNCDNVKHAIKNGCINITDKKREASRQTVKIAMEHRKKGVIQFDKKGNMINKFESVSDATRKTNINTSNIVACCKGKLKQAGGFIWSYENI